MRKPLLCSILILFLHSCANDEPNITGNLRLLTTGRIIDQNDEPLEDVIVRVSLESDGNGRFNNSEISTDANGEFSLTTLYGNNERFVVRLGNTDGLSTFTYNVLTKDYVPEDLIFDLGEIKLKELTFFNLNITKTSGNEDALAIVIKYETPSCNLFYDKDQLIQSQSNCFELANEALVVNLNRPVFNKDYIIPMFTEFEITYYINDGEEITETFFVDEENMSYEITF